MSAESLKNYRILIADQDRELAEVLSKMLQSMGFASPQITRSGKEALGILGSQTFDFLITEWNTQQLDGISVIKKLRTDKTSVLPTLPVLMFTGRAEQSDVIAARDAGVNEFVVKPFSAKTIYTRLERIIEQPRNFVVSDTYIGPDRRHKGALPSGMKDRRLYTPRPNPNPERITASIIASKGTSPRLWTPDYRLKAKLGAGVSLQSIITADVLAKAQNAINAITQESLQWIKNDLQTLQTLLNMIKSKEERVELIVDLGEAALSLSARTGTFGYQRAAEIAYMLYLFCRNHLQLGKTSHATIVQKHIDVLAVIVSQHLTGVSGPKDADIVQGLKELTKKLL